MSKLKSRIKIAVSIAASLVVVWQLFKVVGISVFSHLADIYNGTPLELPLIFKYPGATSAFKIVIKFNDGEKRTLSMAETKYVLKHIKHERLLKALIQGNELYYSVNFATDRTHFSLFLKKLGKFLCSRYDICDRLLPKEHLVGLPDEISISASKEMMYEIFKESDAGRKWKQILLDTRQQLEKKIELLISESRYIPQPESRSIPQPNTLASTLYAAQLELTLPYPVPPELIPLWGKMILSFYHHLK